MISQPKREQKTKHFSQKHYLKMNLTYSFAIKEFTNKFNKFSGTPLVVPFVIIVDLLMILLLKKVLMHVRK